jgi:gluconolactonase
MGQSPYEILDPRFAAVQGDVRLQPLYEGCRWAEGPTYVPAGRYLVWSDIPNDRMLRWDETTGVTGVFREPAGYSNGTTMDRQGRLVACEHGNRCVSRTEHDGRITIIADRFEGKRLNSPNDVVVADDDAVWFTDSAYGIDSHYEGIRGESEIAACNVYRVNPLDGRCHLVADDFERPTGIAFSPGAAQLYVADSRRNHIRVFDVEDGCRLVRSRVLVEGGVPSLDSMRLDGDGRIWIGALDGVHCYMPDGTLIGKIPTPDPAANVEFGGRRGNLLFICASTAVYSIMLAVTALRR